MSLLSYSELMLLSLTNVINGVGSDMINSTSIDLTLGDIVLVERAPACANGKSFRGMPIELANRDALFTHEINIAQTGYQLQPGEFILAHTRETFNLPTHISAEYKLKSSMARMGLDHLNAGWCDAGWNGSVLTLELKNVTRYHAITIRAGDRIGQMTFWKHTSVPDSKSYAVRGRYNGDLSVSGVK